MKANLDILLVGLGSAGDVHPFVGLGRALQQRGHSVTLATNPHFEPLVRQAGLAFSPLSTAEEYRSAMEDPDLWHPAKGFRFVVDKLILPLLEPLYRLVSERYVPGKTVVAAPATAFGARLANEKLGVPLATVHLQPAMLRSVHQSSALPMLLLGDWVPQFFKRFEYWLTDVAMVDRLLAPGVNRFREGIGLPPARRLMADWWHSRQRIIGLFPDWYAPVQPDWPAQVVLTGFPLWDERDLAEIQPELESFLAAGSPPIVFTPGSAMLHGQAFFRAAVEACQRLGQRGILLTRYPKQLPAELPPDVRHLDFIPLSQVLPRSAALVSHGGIGTVAQGLAAGIPQLIMPMSHDQPDNADRLRRLGVGSALKPSRFRGPAVALAIDRLLRSSDVGVRCQALAAQFDTAAAIDRSCREIESLASGAPSIAAVGQ